MPRNYLIFIFLLFISSCSPNYYKINETEFYAYLKNNYNDYASYKKISSNNKISKKLEKKADKINKGIIVLPENVSKKFERNNLISIGFNSEDQNLKDKMYSILNDSESKVIYPEETANIQFYYDCWYLENELNGEYNQISRCRQGFLDSLNYLDFKLTKINIDERLFFAKNIEEPKQEKTKFFRPKKYIVYFGFDSSVVDQEASKVIWNLINDTKKIDCDYFIKITGHADRAGNIKYNKKLSKRRTDTIKHYLIKNGINQDIIKESWSGEEDPSVITSNGSKEYANRRVVITIEKIK